MGNLRRELLLAGAAACGLGAAAWRWRAETEIPPPPRALPDAGAQAEPRMPVALPGMFDIVDAGQPFVITARAWADERARSDTGMLAYTVEQFGRQTVNPVLRVRRGQSIQAQFLNQLDQTSIVHWHGLHVDANNDGNPHYAVGPGQTYGYRIGVRNRAGTCWYHPHPHAQTASQVYRGLAGFLVVQDEADDALSSALDLTLGVNDLPLLLQDRRLDRAGRFVRAPQGAELFLGFVGATPMVNHVADARLEAEPRIYRLRLLNGCSSRVLCLGFFNGERVHGFSVVGADGGLLARPLTAERAFLAPGERLDVLVDLRALAADSVVTLRSVDFDPMRAALAELCRSAGLTRERAVPVSMPAAPARSASDDASSDGAAMDFLAIRVRPGPRYQRSIPPRLASVPEIDTSRARVRRFLFDHQQLRWAINGVRFDMVRTQLSVERGTTEIWEFHSPPRGMPHPVHMHGFAFRLLERRGSPEHVRRLALDASGLAPAETGWKDTFLLWPGERVRAAIDFAHEFPGEQVYMLHCHNLEHEDQGMMLNVRIVPPGSLRA